MAPNVFLLSCLFNDIKGPPPLMTVPITPLPSAHFFVFSPHLITLQFIYKYIVTLISFLYLDHARYIPSSGTSHHGSYFSEHSFFHSSPSPDLHISVIILNVHSRFLLISLFWMKSKLTCAKLHS